MSSQAESTNDPAPSLVASRFELHKQLYVDGFGEVREALDRKTGKPVTLRTLKPEIANEARAVLRALGNLSHTNLLPNFGVVTHEGASLLVQGALNGRHVAAFVSEHAASGKPVSLRGAYNVVAHVCNALTAIHATGPHGALRPGCVWVGGDGRVQLADLVVARATLARGGTGGLPEAEIAYLAPEIKGGGAPTCESDIFGLGALLYVLLTGRSPRDAFVPPSQAHREATPAIDAELMRALSPDPRGRHPTPDAFRNALLDLLGEADPETTADFGVDVEVEVNLASRPPSRRPNMRTGETPIAIPSAPRMPAMPEIGTRISLTDAFRPSIVEIDESDLAAARERRSLGEVDLKDVLAKITEDDAPRWMVVKNGMDHGPFSGRQLVNMIVQGEALREHELMNSDTGRRGKIAEFPEFQDFLAQYEQARGERERAAALTHAEHREKRSTVYKLGIGLGAVALIGLAGTIYALSRSAAGGNEGREAGLDMYKRGNLEITGSAGILPPPRAGQRRGTSSGGSGSGLSYEDAMMQAVDLGSAVSGGEQQLSASSVAGVMNKHLNQVYAACVRKEPGKVTVDIAIAGSGQVLGVSVNAGDPGLQRCVADQVRRIRFPSFSSPRMGARYSFGS